MDHHRLHAVQQQPRRSENCLHHALLREVSELSAREVGRFAPQLDSLIARDALRTYPTQPVSPDVPTASGQAPEGIHIRDFLGAVRTCEDSQGSEMVINEIDKVTIDAAGGHLGRELAWRSSARHCEALLCCALLPLRQVVPSHILGAALLSFYSQESI